METLSSTGVLAPIEFTKIAGPKPRNERDHIINQIYEKLQKEWKPFYTVKTGETIKKVKVQPITLKRVAIKVSYIKNIEDLYYLLSSCTKSTSFTRMFNYLTKSKQV